MINLFVVGKYTDDTFSKYADGYRGVDRIYIQYPFEYYDTNHLVLKTNDKYEELTKVDVYLHDINFARELRDVYNIAYPDINYEIIEILYEGQNSEFEGVFLGYDINCKGESKILRTILYMSIFDADKGGDIVEKIIEKVAINFKSLLNENQLFNTYSEAKLALAMINDIYSTFDKTNKHKNFEVVKLYSIN